jgi:hypothetical protein
MAGSNVRPRSDALGLARQLARYYGLHDVGLRRLNTPVNDVFRVMSSTGEFALKLYHRNRTAEAVEWEADLVAYLLEPSAQPMKRRSPHSPFWVTCVSPPGNLTLLLRLAALLSWASKTCRPSLTAGSTGKLPLQRRNRPQARGPCREDSPSENIT